MSDDKTVAGNLRWQPNRQGVQFLIDRGKIEQLAPSGANAHHLVQEAPRHLASAQVLATTDDVSAAFVTAYDGLRESGRSVRYAPE